MFNKDKKIKKEKKEKIVEYDENGEEIIPVSVYYKIFGFCCILAVLFVCFVKYQHDKSYNAYLADMEKRKEYEIADVTTTTPIVTTAPVESTLIVSSTTNKESPVVTDVTTTTETPVTTTKKFTLVTSGSSTTPKPVTTTTTTTKEPDWGFIENPENDNSNPSSDSSNPYNSAFPEGATVEDIFGNAVNGNHGGISDNTKGDWNNIVGH